MPFSNHLLEFFKFIIVGLIIGIIFDFFRAYRKTKKVSTFIVNIQDIIYFIIVLAVILASIILFLDTEIRFYIFLAMFFGASIYFLLISKLTIKLFVSIIKLSRNFIDFLVIPEKLIFSIIIRIKNILAKFIKICCKKFLYIVSLCRRLVFCVFKKQKRLEKHGKKSRGKKVKKERKKH